MFRDTRVVVEVVVVVVEVESTWIKLEEVLMYYDQQVYLSPQAIRDPSN